MSDALALDRESVELGLLLGLAAAVVQGVELAHRLRSGAGQECLVEAELRIGRSAAESPFTRGGINNGGVRIVGKIVVLESLSSLLLLAHWLQAVHLANNEVAIYANIRDHSLLQPVLSLLSLRLLL